MPSREVLTRERILLAALTLFSQRGIQNTGVRDVANLRVEQVFQRGLATLERDPLADWASVPYQIGEDPAALPPSDAFARSDEIKRLYTDVHAAIQDVRAATLGGLFQRILDTAERQGLLRTCVSRPVVQAIFWELAVNFFDNPRYKGFRLTGSEACRAMTDILLHGILTVGRPAFRERRGVPERRQAPHPAGTRSSSRCAPVGGRVFGLLEHAISEDERASASRFT
jgi:hypothetical protein